MSTNVALLSTNFLGTVGGVDWYGTRGTVGQKMLNGGTVQRVQWYSAGVYWYSKEGAVVRYRGAVYKHLGAS